MTEKIEFYKELLHIDPTSKVFYPLAVLLFEARRLDETVKVLRQGLAAYGDHLEARLLLVEALDQLESPADAMAEADTIIRILSRSPAFWRLWTLKSAKESKDLALALNFLATYFQGRTVSWAELIQSAFEFLGQGKRPPYGEEVLPFLKSEQIDTAMPVDAGALPEDDGNHGQPRAPEKADTTHPVERQARDSALDESRKPLERRPGGSLRTRTMADLLAAQGDYEGAAEIYEELLQDSVHEQQRQALIEALGKVRAESAQKKGQPFFGGGRHMDIQAQAGSSNAQQPTGERTLEKEKLITMLEKLAQRLEGRSQP